MPVLTDSIRLRKAVAGVALICAPLAGFISCLPDSTESTGESGTDLYATVQAHAAGIQLSGLIFMLSAMLTVPMALGAAHLLRHRGAGFGAFGAAALCAGAFGHFGYGFWQVMISRAAGLGDVAAVAYLGRLGSEVNILMPQLLLVDLGVLLLAIGLLRSRTVPAWAPWLTLTGIVIDIGIQFTGVTANWPITALWAVLTVSFGCIGLRVLAMPVDGWAAFYRPAPAATTAPDPVLV